MFIRIQRDKELEQFEEFEDGIFDEPEDMRGSYDVSHVNSPELFKSQSKRLFG